MFGIGTINWKDAAQNLVIAIICFLTGAFAGYKASTIATDNAINQLKPTIDKAIDKETIKNTINNAIDLKIDKIKKSDTLKIEINQTPNNNQKPKNIIIKNPDTTTTKKVRKGFFGRLFSKEDYKDG
ncbi:MAG: hypothetical protein ACM31G_09675 [Flavobacteriales bacterium]